MFVQNHMTTRPRTVGPEELVSSARHLLEQYGIHQLPVVNQQNHLLGLVTERELWLADHYDHQAGAELRVEEIMQPEPPRIRPDAPLEEAAALFTQQGIDALPVTLGAELVGLLTLRNLLRAFNTLLGWEQGGSRIEVAIPLGAADIANVMETLSEEDEIVSVVAAQLRQDGAEPVLYLRTRSLHPWKIEKRLRERGAILLMPERPKPLE
ncbi:MAG: Inosine-5'-monophosphate dehydrogenase [Phycisphaerae bacterium]|nr:Inosine-5'-monophosphate dehydrogenase [Phycisphaerae bacterium]